MSVINDLSVSISGNPENPPLIFVHGFPFDKSMWSNQIAILKDEFYCVAYDVRGLGDSYIGDGQYTMEAFALDLFAVMHELKLETTALCGLSMGGYISLRTVQKDPSRFTQLILLDTKAEADPDPAKLNRANHINMINTEGLSAFVDHFVPPLFSEQTRKTNPELVEDTLRRCNSHDAHGVKGSIFAMLSRTSTEELLPKLEIPVLLLAGEDDVVTPPEMMRAMAERIPNSEYHTVPNAGHMTPLENPEFVNEKLMEFLQS